MADLAKLVVSLEAQTTKYMTELDRANKRLDRFSKQQEKSIDIISAGFKRLGTVLAGVGFSSLIKSTIDANNHLGDMSVRLGISAEALSRLQYAAELTGVSASTLEMGLQRMTRRIAEAAVGSGEAQGALRELGLSATDLAKLAPEEQFKRIADALNGVTSEGEKVRLAMKLFDSEGVALLQTLNGGSAALEEFARQSDRFGRTVTDEAAAAATEFNANLIQTKSILMGLVQTILNQALPAFNRFARVVQLALNPKEGDEFVKQLMAVDNEIRRIETRLARWEGRTTNTPQLEAYLDEQRAELERLQRVKETLEGRITDIQGGVTAPPPVAIPEPPKVKDTAFKDIFEEEAKRASAKAASVNAQVEAVRLGLLTEEEAVAESYNRRNMIVEDALARRMISEEKAADLIKRNEEKRSADLVALQEQEGRQRAQALSTTFGIIASLSEGAQGRASALHKAAAITQATIDGIAATQAALKGPPGPPFSFALAASVAAMTAANIAKIAGTRAMGGPVTGGKTYLVGERGPELFTPSVTGAITPNGALSPELNVTIIEDASKAGQVNQNGMNVEVYVAAAMARIASDVARGRGMATVFENQYGLRRRG